MIGMTENLDTALSAALEDFASGKPIILTQDGPHGPKGAVVIAAEHADATQIAFVAIQVRGLVCLALPRARIDHLGIQMQPLINREAESLFAVSIEACEGVSTGISAPDRARTIQVAIDQASSSDDISTPGHVFPIAAVQGGVLVRAGQSEAAVDLARLAGTGTSAVVCDILDQTGEMAGPAYTNEFAREHEFKQISLADLVRYRLRYDPLLKETYRGMIELLNNGRWELRQFEDDAMRLRHSVLTLGAVEMQGETPVFVGQDKTTLGHPGFVPTRDFAQAAANIRAAGCGVILLLNADLANPSPESPLVQDLLRRIGVRQAIAIQSVEPDQLATAHTPQMIDGGWR